MTANIDRTMIVSDVSNLSSRAMPAEAHFYCLPVGGSELVASLTVEVDDELRAVRSELCFHGQPEATERDGILRTAYNILAKRYVGDDESTPIVVFRRDSQYPVGLVTHEEGGAVYEPEPTVPLWIVAAATALIFVALFFVSQLDNVTGALAPDRSAVIAVSSAAVPTPPQEFEPAPAATGPASAPPNTNGLPPSRNADSRLAVGMTVVIENGLRSFVRTEPGADQGQPLGYLQDGEQAVIQGGPVWLEGDADTIVWWNVSTQSGLIGWTPANTSNVTLLVPVEP